MRKAKVIVTGGCGFIGREVVRQLLAKNYYVIVLDDFSNSIPLIQSNSLKVIRFDLTKSNGIIKYFNDIDYCIHLAAKVGGIKFMNEFQSEILKENILIDLNVINTASLTSTKLVYASTVIVYDQLKPPYKEDQMISVPKSDYAFEKFSGERLCQAFGRDQSFKFAIARIVNVYGINPNKISEKKLHVIPDLIRKILRDRVLQLIGRGKQIKTFVHVCDVASALILMMENQKADGEIFNVGSSEKYKILEVAKMLWKILKDKELFQMENIELAGNDFVNSSVDISKLSKILGWKAKYNLRESLPEIVNWYKEVYAKKAF